MPLYAKEPRMTQFYVDVSHHDRNRRGGPLDWQKIRQYTAPVMVARATYGDPSGWHRSSNYHAEFHSGAKAAGFDVRGSYHNLVKGDAASIARQVDWLRREMDAVGAVWAMLDVERYEELVAADMWPRWDDVQQFCDRWHAVDGRVLTAYIPGWLYSGYYAGKDMKALRVPLVESDYGSNPGGLPADAYAARGGDDGRGWNPTGNLAPTFWQFSSECDMPGASGKTDINAFRGSLAELRTVLTGQPQEEDMPLSAEDLEKVKTAVVLGVHRALDLAATRVDATGRQMGDDIAALLAPVYAGQKALGEALAREASNPDEVRALLAAMPQPTVDADALAAALAPKLVASLPADSPITDEQLARVLRTVLGSLNDTPQS